jgi:membrane protease YdiL (CAAX protease family)
LIDPENNLPPSATREESPAIPSSSDETTLAQPPAPEGAPAPAPIPYAKYPEDLRAPWTWLDVLIFIFLTVGIQMLLDFAMVSVLVALGWVKPDPQSLNEFARTSAGYVTLRQVILSVVMLGYLFFALQRRSSQPFWRMLGWQPLHMEGMPDRVLYLLYALAGVPLAIAISLLSKLAEPRQQLPMEAFFQDARSVLMLSAMGILVAPLVEETVFRGFLYPVAARTFGIPGGVLVTGALFGAMHAPQLWGGWAQIGLLALVGIVFTYVRARAKTVTACYLLHLGYNSFLFLGFFLATDFLRNIPTR